MSVLFAQFSFGQKKIIDNETFKNWRHLELYEISNNGKFIWYTYNTNLQDYTLVVCNTSQTYKREFAKVSRAKFTEDSKYLIFESQNGINLLTLENNQLLTIDNASAPDCPKEGGGRWLSYKKSNTSYLRDLSTGTEKSYSNVLSSTFNLRGTLFALRYIDHLLLVDLLNGQQKIVKHGKIYDVSFDNSGKQIAILVDNKDSIELYYYRKGMDSAYLKASNQSSGILTNYKIASFTPTFSRNDSLIFIKLKHSGLSSSQDSIITSQVDIWNHLDIFLQSQQLTELNSLKEKTFTAIVRVDLKDKDIIQIENQDTILKGTVGNKYAIVHKITNPSESYWNKSNDPCYEIISVNRKKNTILPIEATTASNIFLSPNEKYVIWFDTISKHYCSYEISTGRVAHIALDVNVPLVNQEVDRIEVFTYGIAGWLQDDEFLLIYDKYDVWKIDPKGIKKSININDSYGRLHKICFRLIPPTAINKETYNQEDDVLLAGLNLTTKINVFLKTKFTGNPPLQFFEPEMMGLYYSSLFPEAKLVKAKYANVYLLRYENASYSPNICITKDFKKFDILSDIHPERQYNWLTTELVTWDIDSNKSGTGILYRPENFDSTQKYPVIFTYYEHRSHELFKFKHPSLSAGDLNIPWYVSNGYLVFVPDISHRSGSTSYDITNTIVSAVKKLSTFPYVDTAHMGLQGHSFGGLATNILITNTSIFAAAQESAGIVEQISRYGDIGFGGKSHALQYEIGQCNLGSMPWDKIDIYVRNSPILKINKVTTPLLILHNMQDDVVSFKQGLQMFIGLRRLNKSVWLLQYDGEGHVLDQSANMLDFTIRQQQFFNHYLKNTAMPTWMAEGIPASQKGIRSGLNINSSSAKIQF